MSTPIFKASIPLSNPLFHSLHPVPWTSAVNGISKKEKLLLLSGAQLSPVSLRYPLSSFHFFGPNCHVFFYRFPRANTNSPPELHPNRLPENLLVTNCSTLDDLVLCPDANSFHRWNRAGKDAFFISSYNGGVLAIADGVSGAGQLRFPSSLVRKAHAATSSIDSATVIVAMLEGNGMLKFANVGDRGLKLIREEVLANLARVHSLDSSYESPYALEARVLSYHGGKRSLACNLQARQTFCFSYFNIYGVFDDITVIVG
ncbi:unnamed protein product [Linum tenue]|uniref:Protein phosphatase n=1 Tax=Linum tenue TaxID=586396 RepID=A0AAV0IP87_9ROSI|nr:unnamed protein product [Linum tenue]